MTSAISNLNTLRKVVENQLNAIEKVVDESLLLRQGYVESLRKIDKAIDKENEKQNASR